MMPRWFWGCNCNALPYRH